MANENVYISQLNEATSASDSDKMLIEGTETKRISFTNLCNAIKTKLGLKTGATSTVANNDTTTDSGYVADARIVKTHGDEIDLLNNKVPIKKYGNYSVTTAAGSWITVVIPYGHTYSIAPFVNVALKSLNLNVVIVIDSVTTDDMSLRVYKDTSSEIKLYWQTYGY